MHYLLPEARVHPLAFRKVNQNWLVIYLKNSKIRVDLGINNVLNETFLLFIYLITTAAKSYLCYCFILLHQDDVMMPKRLFNNQTVLLWCVFDTKLYSFVFLAKMKSLRCREFIFLFCKTKIECKIWIEVVLVF